MISPQIYFNNVYFDHSQLYNVNIFTSKKSGEVLRQQTGIINIHLYEPGVLDFNSDRSNITESEKSLLLKEFLDFISASIQINTKEILAKETGDEPSITKFEIIVNDAIPDKIKVKNDLQTIDYNGVIQESFDVSKVGIWTLIYKNNEKYIINVIDYPDPTFKLIIKKLIVGIEYNLDEIIKFTDCCGTERIVPKLEYFPVDSRIFDKKNKTLQVNQSGILRIKGSFTDKISNKSKKIDIDVLVDQKVSAEINIKNNVFISPSTYLGSNIKSNISKDIVDFINAINELYTNKINIIVIVSSLRTLIELMCCDILDVFEIDKQLYLKDNAREIFRDGYFEKCIDDNIEDIRINKSLKSIYNIHKSVLQDGSFIDKYNLATHTGIRLIGSAEIERDIIIVNLIYTYLILVSREK